MPSYFNKATSKWEDLEGANGSLATAGYVAQKAPDAETQQDILSLYGSFDGITGADFVSRTQYSNGQTVTALSADPLSPSESRITLNLSSSQPCALEIEASMIRNRHAFATVALYEDGPNGPDVVSAPINIANIYQSTAMMGVAYNAIAGSSCTVTLVSALPAPGQPGAVYLSDWISIVGLVDNRLNYQNACINAISADRKTITFAYSDEAIIPALAVPVITPAAGTASVVFYNNMAGAQNGFGYRFSGNAATSAVLVSMFGGGDAQVSGSLLTDHRASIGTTAPQYLNGVFGNVEVKATTRYRLEGRPTECTFMDRLQDNFGQWTVRASRTAVKPAQHSKLTPRFRMIQPPGMSRPVAKIVGISKAGTTTAMVTHDGLYPFVTGQYVTIKGVRDQVNFPVITTAAQITVLSPTQFTCVLGTAVTATSAGGSVILANGGIDQPGIVGMVVQSATMDTTGWLTLTGSSAWTGISIGDYINVHGLRNVVGGSDLGVDGAWEIAQISTTVLILKPIFDIFNRRVSPVVTPFASVNCGGSVILRTTLRSHDLVFESWTENKTMLDGQGTNRLDKAVPVHILTAAVPVAGVTAVDAVPPFPVYIGVRASNANITAMSATGDLVGALATMIGALITKPYSLPEADWNYLGTLTTNADTSVQGAGGLGIKRYVTAMQLQNTHASVATTFIVKDGTIAKHTISLPANMPIPIDLEFPTPLATTANAALNIACGTTGANVLVNIQGYTAP